MSIKLNENNILNYEEILRKKLKYKMKRKEKKIKFKFNFIYDKLKIYN